MTLTRKYAVCPDCKAELTAPDGFEFNADEILCDACWDKRYLKEAQECERWEQEHRYDDVNGGVKWQQQPNSRCLGGNHLSRVHGSVICSCIGSF
jgi:hypothetical protein